MKLFLRREQKKFEHRVILTPENCKQLIVEGANIVVESSKSRCFSDDEYSQVGCQITSDSYEKYDKAYYIMGLKELYGTVEDSFKFCHVYFAHCYKNQTGWKELLCKFKEGRILDLEFLTLNNRRVAAFGYYAGYSGVALSLDIYNGNSGPYEPQNKTEFISKIKSNIKTSPKVLIIGALGRCGKGAIQCCLDCGIPKENILEWDMEETKKGGPFHDILQVDIFINCVYLTCKINPFLTKEMLNTPNIKLSIVCDVSCDYTSPNNPIPIYNDCTTFESPTVTVNGNVKVISIDHLPTLLPREASSEFGSLLLPFVKNLPNNPFSDMPPVWNDALEVFNSKLKLALE